MWINTIIKKFDESRIKNDDKTKIVTPYLHGWDKKNNNFVPEYMCKDLNLFPLFMYYIKELSYYQPYDIIYNRKIPSRSELEEVSIKGDIFPRTYNDKMCYVSTEFDDKLIHVCVLNKINYYEYHMKNRQKCVYNRKMMMFLFMKLNDIKVIDISKRESTNVENWPIIQDNSTLHDLQKNSINVNLTGYEHVKTSDELKYNTSLFEKYFRYYNIEKINIENFYNSGIVKTEICVKPNAFLSSNFSINQSINYMIERCPDLYNDLFDICVTKEDAENFLNRQKNKKCCDSKNIFSCDNLIRKCEIFISK